jgi:hypothetical protein
MRCTNALGWEMFSSTNAGQPTWAMCNFPPEPVGVRNHPPTRDREGVQAWAPPALARSHVAFADGVGRLPAARGLPPSMRRPRASGQRQLR